MANDLVAQAPIEVTVLQRRVQQLEAENQKLKAELSAPKENRGLTNSQILHEIQRDMGIAAMLREKQVESAISFLENDLPAFVDYYRSSNSFSDDDIYILHLIRDHYAKYGLSMSPKMFNSLPPHYPACDASTGIKILTPKEQPKEDAVAKP